MRKKKRAPRAGIGNRRPRSRTYLIHEEDFKGSPPGWAPAWKDLPEPRPPAFDFEFPPDTKWSVTIKLDVARDRERLRAEWAEILTRILWLNESKNRAVGGRDERQRVLVLWRLW